MSVNEKLCKNRAFQPFTWLNYGKLDNTWLRVAGLRVNFSRLKSSAMHSIRPMASVAVCSVGGEA